MVDAEHALREIADAEAAEKLSRQADEPFHQRLLQCRSETRLDPNDQHAADELGDRRGHGEGQQAEHDQSELETLRRRDDLIEEQSDRDRRRRREKAADEPQRQRADDIAARPTESESDQIAQLQRPIR